MPWTEITRLHYRREGLRYASDTTDTEWSMIEPLVPAANSIGRPRKTNVREVVNALFYIASTKRSSSWRARTRVASAAVSEFIRSTPSPSSWRCGPTKCGPGVSPN
jgi:Putative transposase of IS4/5 family (DUF4096)